MSTLFDSQAREAIKTRLNQLSPQAQRQWGTMSVGQMICHLCDHLGVALGRVASTPAPAMTSNPIMQWFAIRLMPWPKGKLESPKEQFTTEPGEFEADRDRLKELIDEFAAKGAQGEFGSHSIFGNLGGKRWGQLAHRHIDFHLRQFGV